MAEAMTRLEAVKEAVAKLEESASIYAAMIERMDMVCKMVKDELSIAQCAKILPVMSEQYDAATSAGMNMEEAVELLVNVINSFGGKKK